MVIILLEEEKPCEMRTNFLDSEDDVRCILMNTLFRKGVSVWDCPAEIGNCDDPIILDNVPYGIRIGDFPILLDCEYYIIEIKWMPQRCRRDSRINKYRVSRRGVQIHDGQSNALLNGNGVLLVVQEPAPTKVGLRGFSSDAKEECEKKLLHNFKEKLGANEISYWVWVLDQEQYTKFWREWLSEKTPREEVGSTGGTVMVRMLATTGLEEIVPEARTALTLKQIRDGNLADIVINKLRKK